MVVEVVVGGTVVVVEVVVGGTVVVVGGTVVVVVVVVVVSGGDPLVPTARMRSFPVSATNTVPEASMATPDGVVNWAAVPEASLKPALDPARVVTSPAVLTMRIRWFPESPTTSVPDASIVSPAGLLNCAPDPFASAEPVVEPASVVTSPADEMTRIRLLPESLTKSVPLPSMTIPFGLLNCAAVPLPSA